MKNKLITFESGLAQNLRDPKFRKEWERLEPRRRIAHKMIEARLNKKMSQRTLAKKLKTSPAVISRLETMDANPSLSMLQRIAGALDLKLTVSFE
jgi:ribosome-binding protein aMBF1 (putative translation factor)